MLFRFLSEFFKGYARTFSVIVMDEHQMEPPRQYRIKSSTFVHLFLTSALFCGLILVTIFALTPLRELIPSRGTAEMQNEIRLNALRVAALSDSLEAQQQYASQLRRLIMGQVDSTFFQPDVESQPSSVRSRGPLPETYRTPSASSTWQDHEQPALPVPDISVGGSAPVRRASLEGQYLSSLAFPAQPPVEGFMTRGFNARNGHFAIDIAAEEGSVVRSVGDGYVIFSDWTHSGGYTLVIQHADEYVSVYKHAKDLLKRVGDRVQNREPIAHSGNSGEITTGPHLHFELWRGGLAQDPSFFLIGG